MATGIIDRPGPSYQIRYQLGGKTHVEAFPKEKGIKAAMARRRELLTRADRGKAAPSRDTFADWQQRWRDSIRATTSPMTQRGYESAMRLWLNPEIGHVRLRDIDRTLLRSVYAKLAERLSANTILTVHRIVSGCLAAAVEANKIDSNPAIGWGGRGLPKRRDVAERSILTPADARKLLDAARAGPTTGNYAHHGWMLFPVLFALGAGLRRSEIAALTWDRVNLDTGEVVVSESIREMSAKDRRRGPTKTGKTRTVVLPEWAVAELRGENVSRFRRGPICVKPNGQPINPDAMTNAFAHLAERIGRPELTFHDLRHTCCSWALDAGASIKDVQQMAGHAKASTTLDVYAHVVEGHAARTAGKLDSVMRNG